MSFCLSTPSGTFFSGKAFGKRVLLHLQSLGGCLRLPGAKALGHRSQLSESKQAGALGRDGSSETGLTVLLACGAHASRRQVQLPVWTHADFIQTL